MKKRENESIIIVLLVIIILILSFLATLLATGTVSYKSKLEDNDKAENLVNNDTVVSEKTDIFKEIVGTYIQTNHSDACGDYKLTLELTSDGKATLDIKDECSGNKNGSVTYTIGKEQVYIIFDKPLSGETEVKYETFEYTYNNSKLTIYSNNKELIKQ